MVFSMTGARSRSPQHPSPASHRHTLCQTDFGGHGKSQFHNRPFRQRALRVKEYAPAAQVLNVTGHSPSFEANGQWRVHGKALRGPALTTAFQVIGIGAHGSRLSPPIPYCANRRNANSIAEKTGREVPRRLPARPVEIRLQSKQLSLKVIPRSQWEPASLPSVVGSAAPEWFP